MKSPMAAQKTVLERWLLNVGAVLGALCLVLAAASVVFGIKPLIFSSGSMGPAIHTGSLALAFPAAAAEVDLGDVVSVATSDGVRVTHRVVANDPATGLALKGDANPIADLQPYTGANVDRVVFSIPGMGYVASWLSSPWLFGLGGLLCAYLIYGAFFRRDAYPGTESADGEPVSSVTKPRTRRRTWLGIGAISVIVAVAVPLGVAAKVESTQAAWTGSAVASSGMTASKMPPAGALSCQEAVSGNRSVTVKWQTPSNAPVAADLYRIEVTAGGQSKDVTVPASTTSQVLSLDDPNGLLGGLVAALGNLLDFLLGAPKPVGVSVVAIYPGGWESGAVLNGDIAKMAPYLLVSAKIECTQ